MPLTKLAQKLINDKFSRIKYGIDATCGNGNDTLFLVGICDPDGMIFSFDIQEEALDITEKLLSGNNITQSVMLVNSGHENMEKVIKPKVDVVMFNLGFLPYSESTICTKPETTIPALVSACNLIREGGIITVLCYPGTVKGKTETNEVKAWINGINGNEFLVSEYTSDDPDDTTPVLYVLQKL